jgi:hypothetical protein
MRVPSGGILVANRGADDFESEPTLKAEILASGGGKGAALGMGLFKGRLVLGFIVGGIAVIAMGVREVQLWSASSETPQRMTCRQLAERGPGANANVVLTDFLVGQQVCWWKNDRNSPGGWDAVWVPLAPSDGPLTRVSMTDVTSGGMRTNVSGIQILLKSKSRHSQPELASLYGRDLIAGTVVNCIDSVGAGEMSILQSAYPGTDFSQCWILEENRKPSSPVKCVGLFAVGGLLLVAPIGFMRRQKPMVMSGATA